MSWLFGDAVLWCVCGCWSFLPLGRPRGRSSFGLAWNTPTIQSRCWRSAASCLAANGVGGTNSPPTAIRCSILHPRANAVQEPPTERKPAVPSFSHLIAVGKTYYISIWTIRTTPTASKKYNTKSLGAGLSLSLSLFGKPVPGVERTNGVVTQREGEGNTPTNFHFLSRQGCSTTLSKVWNIIYTCIFYINLTEKFWDPPSVVAVIQY